jgi:hypothetical protein
MNRDGGIRNHPVRQCRGIFFPYPALLTLASPASHGVYAERCDVKNPKKSTAVP